MASKVMLTPSSREHTLAHQKTAQRASRRMRPVPENVRACNLSYKGVRPLPTQPSSDLLLSRICTVMNRKAHTGTEEATATNMAHREKDAIKQMVLRRTEETVEVERL